MKHWGIHNVTLELGVEPTQGRECGKFQTEFRGVKLPTYCIANFARHSFVRGRSRTLDLHPDLVSLQASYNSRT